MSQLPTKKVRITTAPFKLKDRDARSAIQVNLKEMFGDQIPEHIFINKIHGQNNKFYISFEREVPVVEAIGGGGGQDLKGGDNNMDANQDQAQQPAQPQTEDPNANLQTPGTINGETPSELPATETPNETPVDPGVSGDQTPAENPQQENPAPEAPQQEQPANPEAQPQGENTATETAQPEQPQA